MRNVTILLLTVGLFGSAGITASGAAASEPVAIPQEGSRFPALDQMVQEALRANPSILAARKRWEATTSRPDRLSALPNPELSVGSMTGGNPLPFSTIGMEPLDWTSFMFSQSIPWPGKRGLRKEVAQTEAELAAFAYRAQTLDVVRELKEAYFQLAFLDRSLSILGDYRRLLQNFTEVAETRYSVGQGLQQDVLKSHLEVSLVIERLDLLAAERDQLAANINVLMNRSPEDTLPPGRGPEEDPVLELPFPLERLYEMAREENPDLQAERLEIQRSSLELELARKEARPDFTASFGYYLRGGPFNNMYEYRVGIQIPLFFNRKERLEIEENRARLEASRYGYQSAFQDVAFRVKESWINIQTAVRLLSLYRQGIIPQARATLDSSLAAYQVGNVDYLTLINNTLTTLSYELQYQQQQRDYLQSLARLERLTGTVLVR
jgi:outer membrane protein, heavy metal efflux system